MRNAWSGFAKSFANQTIEICSLSEIIGACGSCVIHAIHMWFMSESCVNHGPATKNYVCDSLRDSPQIQLTIHLTIHFESHKITRSAQILDFCKSDPWIT